MSACISRHGEYSSHDLDDEFTCKLCGVLDEDAMRSELMGLRAALAASHAPRPGERRSLAQIIDRAASSYEPVTDQGHESLLLEQGSDMADSIADAILAAGFHRIPPVEDIAQAMYEATRQSFATHWPKQGEYIKDRYRQQARAVIARIEAGA